MTISLPDPEWIELDGAVNVRVVVPGVLLRSDNLQSLSERDVRHLLDERTVEVVIDLRTDLEAMSEGAGPLIAEPNVQIRHHSLYPDASVDDDDGATLVNPWLASHGDDFPDESPVIQSYMSYVMRRPDSAVAAVRAIAMSDNAVLVHCAAGKDRTAVIVALALDAVGVDRALIVQDYLATGERIDAILARLRASETYRAGLEGRDAGSLAPLPGTMDRFLEVMDERFGGSAAWLRQHGLSDVEFNRLVTRLTT